ncbi:hypothetical protein Bca101_060887 [Brassica carinata]
MKKCKAYLDHVESGSQNVIPPIGGTSDNSGKVVGTTKPFDQVPCKKATVKMIVMNKLPFSFVENDGFRHFCEVAVPWFNIPSRRTITRDTVALYKAKKTALETILWLNQTES